MVRHLWGWVLVAVGIISLILPVMPGWVFLIPGLVILSDYFPRVKRLLAWAKEKAGMESGAKRAAPAESVEEKDGGNTGRDRA